MFSKTPTEPWRSGRVGCSLRPSHIFSRILKTFNIGTTTITTALYRAALYHVNLLTTTITVAALYYEPAYLSLKYLEKFYIVVYSIKRKAGKYEIYTKKY
jgi:hypothetical protein